MKARTTAFLSAALAIALFSVSCGGGASDPSVTKDHSGDPSVTKVHSGDSSDPIPVAVGAWADCSVTAKVVSGAGTDTLNYTSDVSVPGDYVVEYRNMSAGVQASDFLWWIGAPSNWNLSDGQEAADFVSISAAGSYDFSAGNDNATTAMACQVRLVLLPSSGFVIPSEGTAAAPVVLTLGAPHAGKVGSWSSDGVFNESFYSFTTGSAGTYTIDASLTDSGSMAELFVNLFTDSSFTGATITFGGLPKTSALAATTTYYLSMTTAVGAGTRPTYQLSVSAP